MRRHLELFGRYFVQYAKVRLAYKADFFVSVVTSLAATLLGLALVFILFQRAPEIKGWSFEEILFLYGFGLIPLALFNTVSVNLYFFGQFYIVEGKFDRVLLRPVHSLFQVMSEQFRLEALTDAVVGLIVIGYAGAKLGIGFDLGLLALGAGAAVCGFAIYFAIFLLLTCVSFWVEDRVGIIPPVYNMITFGRYPLDIYHPMIRFLLSWVAPFGFAAFYPATSLLGRGEYEGYIWLAPLVAATFLAAAILTWNRGVRNYESTGS